MKTLTLRAINTFTATSSDSDVVSKAIPFNVLFWFISPLHPRIVFSKSNFHIFGTGELYKLTKTTSQKSSETFTRGAKHESEMIFSSFCHQFSFVGYGLLSCLPRHIIYNLLVIFLSLLMSFISLVAKTSLWFWHFAFLLSPPLSAPTACWLHEYFNYSFCIAQIH